MKKDMPESEIRSKTQKVTVRKSLKQLGVKNILGSVAVIVFFLALIGVFVSMLYARSKESIVYRGELQAARSSSQLQHFMSQSSDVVKEAKFGSEKLLKEGVPHSEIIEYIVDLTENIQSSIDERFTGVYGFIDGEYMDGAMWVPEEDYVPQERPWYIKAKEADGELVLVEPYMDMETGDLTMTVAQLMEDGESVIALDIKMNMMEEITDEGSEGRIDIIIDNSGTVIAHSDAGQIGANYLEEKDTLGAELANKLFNDYESTFELDYDGVNYIGFAIPIETQGYSVSLTDSWDSFRPLRILLIVTVIITLVAAVILGAVFVSMSRKTLTVATLNDQLTETTYMTEKAIAESEAKTAFLSNMSHEIRTPINAVLGMNEMILRECSDGEILEYAAGIQAAGDTLLGLVNDVLDFSKIEANKMEIVPVEYELSSVLNDLVNMIRTRVEKKGLLLNLKIDQAIPNLLLGDEIRIKQIITNILTNAVKYTEKGSVTFEIGYKKSPEETNSVYLEVRITDTGIGIREEDFDKLFGQFDRIDQEKNRNIEGTGLGMAITRRLLEMMDTSLQVESEYGKGSTFGFSLKQKVISEEPIGDYAEAVRKRMLIRETYRERFDAPDARVLVVDDTAMNLVVFKSLLKKTKMQIDTADDGFDCLEKTKEQKYDIIFLDHMMPEMDGIHTLAKMRNSEEDKNRSTPVVCLTANAVSGARETYLKAGFTNYLTKPIDSVKLEEMILEYLPPEKILPPSDEPGKSKNDTPGAGATTAVEEGRFGNLPGIHIGEGIANCGTEEDYLRILTLFYETIDERSEELDGYLEAEDWENYTIKVHALKSSARIVGAKDLGAHALELEYAGKDGRTDYIRENHEGLMREYRGLKSVLQPVCADGEDEDDEPKREATPGDLARWYDRIEDAVDELDVDEIEEVLEETKGYVLPDHDRELLKKIGQLSTRFDYEGITSLLEDR